MTVTAHSGAFGTPDNTIESIEKVLREDCEIFEVDVSFRPDAAAVIIHKDTPGENEGVLLRDVFALVAGSKNENVRINLDLKSVKNLPAIDSLLKEYGLFDRAFYTGVGEEWTQTVKSSSAVPYYLNADIPEDKRQDRETLSLLAEKVKSLGAIGLNTNYINASPLMTEIFHKKALPVSFWTVDDRETAEKLYKMGADNITTRKPDIFKGII